jgi:hypothetical protein
VTQPDGSSKSGMVPSMSTQKEPHKPMETGRMAPWLLEKLTHTVLQYTLQGNRNKRHDGVALDFAVPSSGATVWQ